VGLAGPERRRQIRVVGLPVVDQDDRAVLGALGRLDGLVVRGTAASRDPASVLQPALDLALPTVLVDGRPGDAEAWAALLIARIGELG